MKNKGWLFGLLVGSVLWTGCFDMVEEVYYKKDGSGTYKFSMDMSGMKAMLAMAMAADTTGSLNMDTLSAVSREFASKVKGLSGVSNVKEIRDRETLVFGVSFDFKDIASLNAAAGQIFDSPGIDTGEDITFSGSKKRFERMATKDFTSIMEEMMGASGGEAGEEMEMAMMFFKDVSYTTIYRFDKKVKKMSNKNAELSNDKKTVTLKYFMFDEDRNSKESSLGNTIKFKGFLW